MTTTVPAINILIFSLIIKSLDSVWKRIDHSLDVSVEFAIWPHVKLVDGEVSALHTEVVGSTSNQLVEVSV